MSDHIATSDSLSSSTAFCLRWWKIYSHILNLLFLPSINLKGKVNIFIDTSKFMCLKILFTVVDFLLFAGQFF